MGRIKFFIYIGSVRLKLSGERMYMNALFWHF